MRNPDNPKSPAAVVTKECCRKTKSDRNLISGIAADASVAGSGADTAVRVATAVNVGVAVPVRGGFATVLSVHSSYADRGTQASSARAAAAGYRTSELYSDVNSNIEYIAGDFNPTHANRPRGLSPGRDITHSTSSSCIVSSITIRRGAPVLVYCS